MKRLKNLFLISSVFLVLGACSFGEASSTEVYTAEVDDLQNIIFYEESNRENTLSFTNETLEITFNSLDIKPWLEPEKLAETESGTLTVDNYNVEVEGDTYTVTGEDFKLILQKIGPRILKSNEGVRFLTQQNL